MKFGVFYHSECLFLRPRTIIVMGDLVQSRQPRSTIVQPRIPSAGRDVYITRLHLRYDREHFPEDLMFQVNGNRDNFQGRYVIRHPFTGKAGCEAGRVYFRETLPKRQQQAAEDLAYLTAWPIDEIHQKMKLVRSETGSDTDSGNWWESLWR
jgi:hypothetical protein